MSQVSSKVSKGKVIGVGRGGRNRASKVAGHLLAETGVGGGTEYAFEEGGVIDRWAKETNWKPVDIAKRYLTGYRAWCAKSQGTELGLRAAVEERVRTVRRELGIVTRGRAMRKGRGLIEC